MQSCGTRAGQAVAASVVAAVALAGPFPAHAASPTPGGPAVLWAVDVGGGVVAGEAGFGVDPMVALAWGAQSVVLGAPLRFGLDGRLRARDWDDPGDPLRVVRRLRLRAGPLEILGGEIAGLSLGYGSMVRGYHGNPDPDHHATGLAARVRTDAFDLDLFADDLPLVDVLAARGALRPAALSALTPGRARLELALTLAADLAPPPRRPVAAAALAGADLDLPAPSRGPSLGAFALEAQWLLHARPSLRVAPFAAAGALLGATGDGVAGGAGLHAGARVHVAPGGTAARVTIDLTAAVVLAGPGYLPAPLGPLYRIERSAFPLPHRGAVAAGTPGLGAALATLDTRGIVLADITVRAAPVEVSLGWESPAGGGSGNRWWLRGALPQIGPVGLAAFVAGDDLAPLLGAAEATLRFGFFYVRGEVSRGWVVDPGAPPRPVLSAWLAAGLAATASGKGRTGHGAHAGVR